MSNVPFALLDPVQRGSGGAGAAAYPIGCNGNLNSIQGGFAADVDTMWAIPFQVFGPRTLANLIVILSAAAAAGGKAFGGIFDNKAIDDGKTMYPRNKIISTAELSMDAGNGLKTYPMVGLIQMPGIYHAVFYPGVAAATLTCINDNGCDNLLPWTPATAAIRMIKVARAWDGTLPAVFPGGGSYHTGANERLCLWHEYS